MSRAVLILLTAGAVLTGLAGCTANDEDLRQWMAEQRRTNRMLWGLVWAGLGFVLGLLLTLAALPLRPRLG